MVGRLGNTGCTVNHDENGRPIKHGNPTCVCVRAWYNHRLTKGSQLVKPQQFLWTKSSPALHFFSCSRSRFTPMGHHWEEKTIASVRPKLPFPVDFKNVCPSFFFFWFVLFYCSKAKFLKRKKRKTPETGFIWYTLTLPP